MIDASDLIGLPWEYPGRDCKAVAAELLRRHGVPIPDIADGPPEYWAGKDLMDVFRDHLADSFVPVEKPYMVGDVVLMRGLRGQKPPHVAVVVNDRPVEIVHCDQKVGHVERVRLSLLSRCIWSVLRHDPH